jgi:two-component system sensor histidine kinase YesM
MIASGYDYENSLSGSFVTWQANDFTANPLTRRIAYIKPIYNTLSGIRLRDQKMGYSIIWARTRALENITAVTAVTPGSVVAVIDEKGRIIASNRLDESEVLAQELQLLSMEYAQVATPGTVAEINFEGKPNYVLFSQNEITGWQTVNIAPLKEVYESTVSTVSRSAAFVIVCALLTIVVGVSISSNISKPFVSLTQSLHLIGQTKEKIRINVTGVNEFAVISQEVNTMLNELETANANYLKIQEELYRSKLLQQESEILALQSQINPHFLYNTLECIRSIAVVNHIGEISSLTTSMANIFRYSIEDGIVSTVKKELDCVNDYYRIMNTRYEGTLTFVMDVPKELESHSMVRMSLQPLLENAFTHGLFNREEPICVILQARSDNGFIIFTMSDDGAGIELQRLEELQQTLETPKISRLKSQLPKTGHGVGMVNINERIKLHYGNKYGLHVYSDPREGTVITMHLPQ